MRSILTTKGIGLTRRHLEFRVFDRFHLDLTRLDVSNSSIARHTNLLSFW